jgi:predicted DNA-binding transcriptional regulator YafY
MENVHISDVIHNEVISFDINRFFQHAIGITVTNSFPDTIIFKADNITSKYINSQPIHVSQSILKTGKNKTTFSLNVIVSEELIRLFLSFGGEVEIIEPESLRNQIIKRVEEMQLKYNI